MAPSKSLLLAGCVWVLGNYTGFFTSNLIAQNWIIEIDQELGQVIRHRPNRMLFDLPTPAHRISLELIPPSSPSYWRSLYRYPRTGWGISHQTYGNAEALGSALLGYALIEFPLILRPKFRSWLTLELGLAWHTTYYNPNTQPGNTAISLPLNIHTGPGIQCDFSLNQKFDLNASARFSHQSNANVHQPNLGLNSWFVGGGLTYHVGGQNQPPFPAFKRHERPLRLKRLRYIAQASLLMREAEATPTLIVWPGFSLMAAYNLSDKGSLWAGGQVLLAKPEAGSTLQPQAPLMMVLGYEWLWGNVGFVGQLLWQVADIPVRAQLKTIRVGPHLYLRSPYSEKQTNWQIGCYITIDNAIAQYASLAIGYLW